MLLSNYYENKTTNVISTTKLWTNIDATEIVKDVFVGDRQV